MGDDAGATTTPVAYRRMEVLANAESMRRDVEMVARIRDLVAIGTRATAVGTDGSSSSSAEGEGGGITGAIDHHVGELDDELNRIESGCGRPSTPTPRII